MVLRGRCNGSSYTVSLKPHSIALAADDDTVAAWDRGGRLYSVARGEHTWRHGLSGTMLEKWCGAGGRHRRLLAPDEAAVVLDDSAAFARRVSAEMISPAWQWTSPIDPVTAQEARVLLALCGRFTGDAARADARRFVSVYSPVGILPPDQYLALVVQGTEGCSFNTCTFCDLYHDRYRVKTVEEFRQHVEAVVAYLGASADLRSRGLFLGSANALAVPMTRLVPFFEVLVEELDAMRRGVCGFVDGFTGQMKDADDYRLLGELGLRRVYIGLESGHDPLLRFVRKPGTAEAAIETVHAIKSAGLQVGVIVMTGLGGPPFAEGHVADTAATLTAMHLGPGDLLYFSEFVETSRIDYPRLAAEQSITAMDGDSCRRQRDAISSRTTYPGLPPAIATYDVREFVY